jgi:hypothetical protein
MRAAHVRVAVVDCGDSVAEDQLQGLAGSLGLGELWHVSSVGTAASVIPSGGKNSIDVDVGRFPRVLFIRPDHVGDVLLTLPAVVALRRALPGAHIAYAAPPATAAAAARCPDVDETLAVEFPPFGRPGADGAAWRATVLAASSMLARSFDAALVVRPDDPWSGELVAAGSIPIRLGFLLPRTRPYLTDALVPPGNRHVALDGFDLADALLARLPSAHARSGFSTHGWCRLTTTSTRHATCCRTPARMNR